MTRDHLVRLITFLTPSHRKKWAQAMGAEISCIQGDRAAVAFTLGCLIACFRFHLELKILPERTWSDLLKDRFTISTFVSGVVACCIGLAYLAVSGARDTMIIVNGGAMLMGVLFAIAAIFSIRLTSNFVTMVAVVGSIGLFATANFGYAVEGARRWVLIGPFFMQTSAILLPLIAISFARVQNFWTMLAVVTAGFAIAIQPDRAMAAMLFMAVALICWLRPVKLTITAAVFCGVGFAVTLFLPDQLPAVPFVDHILWTAFDLHIMIGLSLWIGCLILISPILFLPKNERTIIHYTFISCWVMLIAAAAIGGYPTPIVGYGASAIIGYFLSLILIQPMKQVGAIDGAYRKKLSETDEKTSLDQTKAHDGRRPQTIFPDEAAC